MKIVADENIPFVSEAFASLGDVIVKKGREIAPPDVSTADALLVRSVTKVGARLLEGSRVRFVGTATSGTDHVDKGYLASKGIAFFDAAGSNAVSVAEYVVAALLEYAFTTGCELKGKTLGIIGVGHVGTKVASMAEALGMETLLNDPPRQDQTGFNIFRPLEEIMQCDVITLHVPLVTGGRWPTTRLAGESFFSGLRDGAFIINTSRGEVLDEVFLKKAIVSGKAGFSCLDVWADEPGISLDTLKMVSIGTPHIAGYSYDAKVRGTEVIYKALCGFLGREASWSAKEAIGSRGEKVIGLSEFPDQKAEGILRSAVRHAYDIMADDRALRSGRDFDSLRRDYPLRREFSAHRVEAGKRRKEAETLFHLGFKDSCKPFSA